MPPALAPIPPKNLKEILESDGWNVISQNEYHWVLDHPDFDEPYIVPKDTDLVAVELMMNLLYRGAWTLTSYFRFVDQEESSPKQSVS